MSRNRVFASLFAADCVNIMRDVDTAAQAGIDALHFDVMDGRFVPLIGLNNTLLRRIGEISALKVNVHLMCEDSNIQVYAFAEDNVDEIVFHRETQSDTETRKLIAVIRNMKKRVVLGICPDSELDSVRSFFPLLDGILVMASQPGRENSHYLDATPTRIAKLREMAKHFPELEISVDGGLDETTAGRCVEAGANHVIVGRAFYASSEKAGFVNRLKF